MAVASTQTSGADQVAIGEEIYRILNQPDFRTSKVAAKMTYLMRRLLNKRIGVRLDLSRFGGERPLMRKWRIRYIAHQAAKYFHKKTRAKVPAFKTEGSKHYFADLLEKAKDYVHHSCGPDQRPQKVKEISRRVSTFQKDFRDNTFSADLDLEQWFYKTLTMCSQDCIIAMRDLSTRRNKPALS